MKITRLALSNWRNIERAELTLDRLAVIRGATRQGKSSIPQAIEYLLNARNDWTTESGAGAEELIRQGTDKALIEADIQGQDVITVRCSLTEKGGRAVKFSHKTDPTYPVENVKAWLEKQKPVLSCLLNSRHFINLKPAEQKSLLASIILPESYEWPADVQAKCNTVHIGAQIPWSSAPFDVIEKAYKLAFEARTNVNRDLKNLHIPDPIQPPAGHENVNALRERLTQLRQQVAQMEGERRQAERARGEAESNKRILEARIEGLAAKISGEQRTLDDVDGKLLSAKQAKDLQAIAANDKKLAKLEKELVAKREALAVVTAIVEQFDALDPRNSAPKANDNPDAEPCAACPTCKREIGLAWFKETLEPHITRKNTLNNDINNLMREQKEFGDVEGAKRRLEEQKQFVADEARAKGIMHETNALLRTAREELATIIMPPMAIPDESESVAREAISNLEAIAGDVAVAEARAKEIKAAEDRKTKLASASLILDGLCAYFGKDGVKAQLLKEHIGGFTSAINEALAGWGYACSFDIEPYGFKVVNLERHTTHSLHVLSGSERLRFAVAFQVALAKVSGIGLVVVDEADIFDSEARGAFFELLLNSELDQAIAVGTDERESVPEVEGAVFYAMREGRAVQLVPQEVA